jgi:hypothetical protein
LVHAEGRKPLSMGLAAKDNFAENFLKRFFVGIAVVELAV